MIKLVVFDWNCVILADALANLESDNAVLKYLTGKTVNMRRYKETTIIPGIEFYIANGASRAKIMKNMERVADIFHEIYEPRAAKVRTRRGTRALLAWLAGRGVRCIILSNHTTWDIDFHLNRFGIKHYFDTVLATKRGDTTMKRRSKKEKLKVYLKKHKISPRRALIIGDSPEETEIGNEQGLTTVAITGGIYTTRRLQDAAPDYLIGNLGQLL
jgi:phosphoglycolate phosphatase